ncbi:MAG TPA: hypothetical protein VF585_05975, partial [Chthoniobacterales bacterium]
VVGTNTVNLKMSLKAKTGVFSGSFQTDPADKKSIRRFSGVLLESQGIGAGFFLDSVGSGFVSFEPEAP